MSDDRFGKLLAFLERLDKAKIPYTMQHSREDAVMIVAFAPGEYWEIEFLKDGDVEIERYRSDGEIHDETMLEELFVLCSDEKPSFENEAFWDSIKHLKWEEIEERAERGEPVFKTVKKLLELKRYDK